MSAPARPSTRPDRRDETVPDDEYARAYAEGYGEGLREALKEILQHASRGHTAQELRLLIESRLARVRDDVDLKLRSVLSPPRRPSWGAILRPPSAATVAVPPAPPGGVPALEPGTAYLFREPRPVRATEAVEGSCAGFPRLLAVSIRPPTFRKVGAGVLSYVPVGGPGSPGTVSGPTELSGRIRTATELPGGALVYLDAFDTLVTEVGVDPMLKFVTWLVQQAATTHSAVVLSVDPSTLDPRTLSLLQRAFNYVE